MMQQLKLNTNMLSELALAIKLRLVFVKKGQQQLVHFIWRLPWDEMILAIWEVFVPASQQPLRPQSPSHGALDAAD